MKSLLSGYEATSEQHNNIWGDLPMAPVLNNRSPSNAPAEGASHPSSGAPFAQPLSFGASFADALAAHTPVFALA